MCTQENTIHIKMQNVSSAPESSLLFLCQYQHLWRGNGTILSVWLYLFCLAIFVCFGSAQYFWLCFCYYLYQILSSAFFYRKKLNFAIKHISFHKYNSRKKVCFCHRKLCFSWQGDPLSTWKNHKWNRRQEFIWIFLSPLRIPACMSFTGYQSTAEIYITFFLKKNGL